MNANHQAILGTESLIRCMIIGGSLEDQTFFKAPEHEGTYAFESRSNKLPLSNQEYAQ